MRWRNRHVTSMVKLIKYKSVIVDAATVAGLSRVTPVGINRRILSSMWSANLHPHITERSGGCRTGSRVKLTPCTCHCSSVGRAIGVNDRMSLVQVQSMAQVRKDTRQSTRWKNTHVWNVKVRARQQVGRAGGRACRHVRKAHITVLLLKSPERDPRHDAEGMINAKRPARVA